jgi:hypothetical protein
LDRFLVIQTHSSLVDDESDFCGFYAGAGLDSWLPAWLGPADPMEIPASARFHVP